MRMHYPLRFVFPNYRVAAGYVLCEGALARNCWGDVESQGVTDVWLNV
jgi:hypothetical protein